MCVRCRSPLTPDGQFCGACGTPAAGPDPYGAGPGPGAPYGAGPGPGAPAYGPGPYGPGAGAPAHGPGPDPGPRPDWRPPAQVLPAPTQYGPGPPRSGPPRPPSRGPRPALIAGAVIAVLAVAGGATAVVLGLRSSPAVPPVPTSVPIPVPQPAPVPASIPAQVSASLSPPSSAAPTTAAPADLLRRQLDGDAQQVESLVGKWVPQLSSKREGDVVDGTRYDAAAVWADFQSWQQKVPSSVLTRSERFTSFRGKDYWVTLAAEPFDTPEAANAWCVTQKLAAGDCFAKRLSHTEGPAGNTRPR